MPVIFVLLFFVAAFGVVRPFRGLKRWHFAIAAVVAFAGVSITSPKPTPEQIAARKVERERKEKVEAAAKVLEKQNSIIDKARATIGTLAPYNKNEYRKTFERVGKATFSRLGELEPGAVYAVAESKECDRVVTAMVSDRSKPGKAMWFVDCANDNRFMIEQDQAEAALARFEQRALAETALEANCTIDTVAMCKAAPAQKTAMKQEVMHVSACDILLQEAVVSPSSLSMRGAWKTEFSGDDTIIFRRAFDNENSFGARIRSQYRCDVNAVTHNISRFEVQGPHGTHRLI